MEQTNPSPTPDQIEKYRRQMLEMSRRATPAPTPEENWLDRRYPEPNFSQDREAMAPPAPPPPVAQTPPPAPPIAESPFVGYLRVVTFSGNQAEPIEGARVVVSRGDTVYANTETDRDGTTPVIPLPSVDPALTLRPGNDQPYVPYTIQVNAEGFRPVRHENVPVYGNNYVTQPIALLPLLPGADADDIRDFRSGGPANL